MPWRCWWRGSRWWGRSRMSGCATTASPRRTRRRLVTCGAGGFSGRRCRAGKGQLARPGGAGRPGGHWAVTSRLARSQWMRLSPAKNRYAAAFPRNWRRTRVRGSVCCDVRGRSARPGGAGRPGSPARTDPARAVRGEPAAGVLRVAGGEERAPRVRDQPGPGQGRTGDTPEVNNSRGRSTGTGHDHDGRRNAATQNPGIKYVKGSRCPYRPAADAIPQQAATRAALRRWPNPQRGS